MSSGSGTEARYDGIAAFYASAVGDVVEEPAGRALIEVLGELVGEVRGRRVLDLACGHGRMSRVLARLGAEVVGADVSSALLARGRAAEAGEPLGVRYVEVDVTSAGALAGERFEVVTCHFGLSDIDDLEGALGTVGRVLEPGGVFAFSILHPCFPGWGEDAPSAWRPGGGYYREGWWLAENPGFRGQVGSNFRMLSTYLNALVGHGLVIERVAEPDPGAGWAARMPGADAVPVYLVVGCRASEGAEEGAG